MLSPWTGRKKPHTRIANVVVKVVESGILGFKIRNTAQRIQNLLRGIQNPRLSWIPLHGTQHWSTRTNSAVWPVPYACAQPYHPGSGTHGQLWCLRWTWRLKESFALTWVVTSGVDDRMRDLSPGPMPCWWFLMRTKQLSMAPTTGVIWLWY